MRLLLSFIVFLLLVLGIAWSSDTLQYETYQTCRECHSDIFKLWSGSLHAKSYSNPAFQASYLTAILNEGEESSRLCLRCHAPLTHVTQDFELNSPSAKEGVSCWFCHSISSVNTKADVHSYYRLDHSDRIYGPYKPSDSAAHPVNYSPVHLVAELCAGCHEYKNEAGVSILGTFTEWSSSPYKDEEVYCQNCHMPIRTDLKVVDEMEVTNYFVTAHEFRGGHSQINLQHAVELNTDVTRNDDVLNVTVKITNAESGHWLPTGIPIRKLNLTVSLIGKAGDVISSARKVYRKTLVDEFGTIIESAPELFLHAKEVYSDNRIKPRETRVEQFTFTLPGQAKDYKIESVLNYHYTRPLLKEESLQIEMAKTVNHLNSIE
jgi:hypothetical protein